MLVVDTNTGTAESARGAAAAAGSWALDAGAPVEVGPSSGSVDVDVFVRYNAACNTSAGDTHVPPALQFQTPKPGKKSWVKFGAHASSQFAMKVQPLGSSIMLTPVVCTPSGMSGCDGKTAAAPVGAIEHVGVPLTVVERVPVQDMYGA